MSGQRSARAGSNRQTPHGRSNRWFSRVGAFSLALTLSLPFAALPGLAQAAATDAIDAIDAGAATPAPAPAQNLDLSSVERTMAASAIAGFQPTAISVGQTVRTVTHADLLTAAEHVAIHQIMATGQQSLLLGSGGNAVGGTFNLTPGISQQIANLIVPQGVTAVHDFAHTQALNLAGNLVNSGAIYAVSSSAQVTSATFAAHNIINQAGAILSSMLPAGGLAGIGSAVSSLNLNLNAVNNIINQGVIASSGHLNATAGGSIINALQSGATGASPVMQAMKSINLTSGAGQVMNSGLIAATTGSINIATQTARNLAVNNIGGVLQALNGSVNIRDQFFKEKFNSSLTGGSVAARELNIFSGGGKAVMDLQTVAGVVNIVAHEAQMTVASGNLNLGALTFTGDPVFYNQSGNVVLSGNIVTNGQPLAVLAAGDISTQGTASIDTTTVAGNGGAILLVAGAVFSSCVGAGCPGPVLPPTAGSDTLTISSLNPAGQINLTGLTALNSAGTGAAGNGGNITVIAPGIINIPGPLTLGGAGAGASGSLTVIGGAASGTAITLGNVNAAGGVGGGAVNVSNATPLVAVPVTVTNGAVTAGSFAAGATQTATTDIPSIIANSDITLANFGTFNTLTMTTPGSILVNQTAGGSVRLEGSPSQGDYSAASLAINAGAPGNTVNVTVRRLDAPLDLTNTAGVNYSINTYGGNLTLAADLDTSNPAGTAGRIHLQAFGGKVTAGNLTANGAGAGFKGGSILLYGAGEVEALQLNANGLSGAHAGTIHIESNSKVKASLLATTATGGGNGGSILAKGSHVEVTGVDAANASIDSSSTGDSAGPIHVETTSPERFTVGLGSGINRTAGDILANGFVNGGNILLVCCGRQVIVDGFKVEAKAQTGHNGSVRFENCDLEPVRPERERLRGRVVRILNTQQTTQVTTRIATDVTNSAPGSDDPSDIPDIGDDDVLGGGDAGASQGPLEGVALSDLNTRTVDVAGLMRRGVHLSNTSNTHTVRLDHGNVLFSPQEDVVVETHTGNVHISRGSVAFVMATDKEVAVYDLHDGAGDGVKLVSDAKAIALDAGKQLVVTHDRDADFEKINPGGKHIGFRNPTRNDLSERVKAFAAEFSIPAAFVRIAPLREMLKSDNPIHQRATYQLLKNAAILADLTSEAGPFKSAHTNKQ